MLRYLVSQITKSRHYVCSAKLVQDSCSARVDAQASANRTGIGGWFPQLDHEGEIDVGISQWISLEITEHKWPWVFAKSSKPSLAISTLEALAILIVLKVRYGDEPGRDQSMVMVVPSTTRKRTAQC